MCPAGYNRLRASTLLTHFGQTTVISYQANTLPIMPLLNIGGGGAKNIWQMLGTLIAAIGLMEVLLGLLWLSLLIYSIVRLITG